MEWYEPKEKTARIDWRCDTDYWNFKIINLDDNTFGLYRIYRVNKNKPDRLIRVSDNVKELHYCAYDLQLAYERNSQ